MLGPGESPSNFVDASERYKNMSPEDMVAQIVIRDALIKVALERQQAAEEALEKDKYHDPLTGLLNRSGIMRFFEQRRQQFRRATDAEKTDLIMMVDIDKFKHINDTLGHSVGDKALKKVARALELSLRTGDQIARLHGDEFVGILLSASANEGLKISKRIQDNTRALSDADPSVPVPNVSIGIVGIDYALPFNDSYSLSDQAMYGAKRNGGGQAYLLAPDSIVLPD